MEEKINWSNGKESLVRCRFGHRFAPVEEKEKDELLHFRDAQQKQQHYIMQRLNSAI